MSSFVFRVLVALLLVGGVGWSTASAQDTGGTGKKCPNTGVTVLPPKDFESALGKECGSFAIHIVGLPTIGMQGEWCPDYKYHFPARPVCDTPGSKLETKCVGDGVVIPSKTKCDCDSFGWGAIAIPLPFCSCDGPTTDEVPVPKYKEEAC